MSKFKNMKIEINKDQLLDEAVILLEILGYRISNVTGDRFIYTNHLGLAWLSGFDLNHPLAITTTLEELKEM